MLRRILPVAGLLVLLLAPAAEAKCRVALRSDGLSLGRTARGWELCGRSVLVSAGGRPVRFRSHGEMAVVVMRERRRVALHFVETRGRFPLHEIRVLARGERVARHVYVPDQYGIGELYVGVAGRRPHIDHMGGAPVDVVDRTRGLDPRSLRLRGRELSWRIGDARRRISLDHGELPPADCSVPRWARSVRRHGTAATYELRLGGTEFEGAVYGCAGSGPPRRLLETSTEIGSGAWSQPRAIRDPFAVLQITAGWKESSTRLVVHDLRSGEPVTSAGLNAPGSFRAAVLGASGALGFARRTADGEEVGVARPGAAVEVLDSGPHVDGASLRLDGTTLSWLSGGQRRTAELP